MKVILQKVSQADVSVDGQIVGAIAQGYVLLVGILQGDTEEQVRSMAEKITKVRLFEGEDGKINDRSLVDIGGEVLVVSQFTLAGDLSGGHRPDYTAAAPRAEAERLYLLFFDSLKEVGVKKVEKGVFGAHMHLSLINDGPVTLVIDR